MTQFGTLPATSFRPADLAELKVLVVEDHQVTARLIGDVLRGAGVGQVESACDGLSARQMLKVWDPHIIFTDWNMPNMDGLELTRSIRRAAVARDRMVPNPQVPVVMLTATRSQRDVEGARRAGVNEFVIKPFTPASLISRIQLVLTRPRPFIVSQAYVGPCRRRRVEIRYTGPLRRAADPAEVLDSLDRQATRDTIGVELDALRRLIAARGGMDRETLQMTTRVMQHTRHRARQVRAEMVAQVSQSLLDYAEGRTQGFDPTVLDLHFDAVRELLDAPETDAALADKITRDLKAAVATKVRAAKAA